MIIFVYFILVRYVKRMRTHMTAMNTLSRAQRELKMVRRIVILVTVLLTLCFPYEMFLIMSFFVSAPKYDFRIAFIFGNTSLTCVIMALFQFSDPLKASIIKRINRQTNMIIPVIA
jgi:hypothetical protein